MSCTNCGSPGDCGCTNRHRVGCATNLVPASPQPFYNCAPHCQESNTQKIIINQFAVALKVANSWNVPNCGETATLSIPGLVSITIGSYLWNEEFGYFEVTSFDSGLQQVTVVNHCNDGNAAPGTTVPACTEFLNTAPPIDVDTTDLCVAIDFTAPAIGDCIDITLTGTVGIAVGDSVIIGSGQYRVSAIKPNNIITICNDGLGITPGTSVIAIDALGNYNYCLQVIAVSACAAEQTALGRLVVCDTDGVMTTLGGAGGGMIPVMVDGNSNVEFRPVNPPQICTYLTADLQLIIGVPGYNIQVADSSLFGVNDKLVIGGYFNPFTVLAIPDATHLTGSFLAGAPVSAFLIPSGVVVCNQPCCFAIEDQVLDIIDILGPTTGGSQCSFDMGQVTTVPGDVESGDGPGGTLTSADAFVEGPNGDYLIQNTSICKTMVVTVNVHYIWKLSCLIVLNTDFISVRYTPKLGFAFGPIGTTVPPVPIDIYSTDKTFFNTNPVGAPTLLADHVDHHTATFNLAPGWEVSLRAVTRLVRIAAVPAPGSSFNSDIQWTVLSNLTVANGIAI